MAVLMDEAQVGVPLTRIAHEIVERNRDASELALVGVQNAECRSRAG